MNERIRELAIQADLYAKSEYDKWTPTTDFSGVPHIKSIFSEKFAELIVRECQFAIVSRTDLPNHERKLYNNVLKEHFGLTQ